MQDESKRSPDPKETVPDAEQPLAEPAPADDAAPATGTEAEDPLQRLEREKEILEAEKSALKDQMLRAVAEAENTRRRVERERAEAVRYAAIPLLRDLVKVADNLARALAALPRERVQDDEVLKSFREGVELTERDLLAALQRHKVSRIDPMGEALDPALHEAMFEVPDPAKAPGTVVQVLETGWKLHDRLIRPARVAVAKAPD